jgi:hypothetical protein
VSEYRTDDEYREVARAADLGTVDDRAEVKRAIDGSGAWVQVWLWVPSE